ncbi:M23 family metallopeptidase [Georgenia subflava]|uniref:Peptidoglycan DD-metalloendopeptidase family protein n=1 Tax=Georgenia subflava TaxID=1622177 RepID=A0A6N7EDC3_9MICO|nr:M23 family metallopeptidase [Georgenia subflava]MPV36099.1 peptidoglycan DD-metalloendopeptidase family protein [Georgenia subflava]
MRAAVVAAVLALAASLVAVVALVLYIDAEDDALAACNVGGPGIRVELAGAELAEINGYGGVQLANAAAIINAGADLGLSVRDQTIGVMTAMGESSLQVLDHGDLAGPDSRGLFQQRDNGAWGTYEERMDPTASATMFFEKLAAVADRGLLPPTIVAHRVQVNADPYHYERYWRDAVAVVNGLAGEDLAALAASAGPSPCSALSVGAVTAEGWTSPILGNVRYSSAFGQRVHPITGQLTLHSGADLAAPDGHPIYAAADGIVTVAGPSSGGNSGYMVAVDHGGGVQSRYVHPWPSGILVRVGDVVTAGQQIARVGSSGNSTGPHLHFEIRVGGIPVEPIRFLADRGVELPGTRRATVAAAG